MHSSPSSPYLGHYRNAANLQRLQWTLLHMRNVLDVISLSQPNQDPKRGIVKWSLDVHYNGVLNSKLKKKKLKESYAIFNNSITFIYIESTELF